MRHQIAGRLDCGCSGFRGRALQASFFSVREPLRVDSSAKGGARNWSERRTDIHTLLLSSG